MVKVCGLALAAIGFVSMAAQAAEPAKHAGAKKPAIQYLGGFTICAKDPEAMAKWYEAFGIPTKKFDGYDGYFGGIKWENVDFHFGIYPVAKGGEYCKVSAPSYGVSFRVNDFEGYLKLLKQRGLEPVERMEDPEGHFALFRDPEGHVASIWGVDQ